MNQKTVKLLKKYAHLKGMNVKELKQEWLAKSPQQKETFRKEIEKALAE